MRGFFGRAPRPNAPRVGLSAASLGLLLRRSSSQSDCGLSASILTRMCAYGKSWKGHHEFRS